MRMNRRVLVVVLSVLLIGGAVGLMVACRQCVRAPVAVSPPAVTEASETPHEPQPLPKRQFTVVDPVDDICREIMLGPYGKMPIGELLDVTLETHDPSQADMQLALLLRKEESLPLLRERLRAPQDERTYDLLMLIHSQLRWSETVPEILALLKDKGCSERVRGRAATGAALFQVKEAVPAVRDLLTNGVEVQSRQLAAMALGLLRDTESQATLQKLLQDSSPHMRATAAMVLGQLCSKAGEDVAMELSHAERFDLRCRAAEALSYIGSPTALARLHEMEKMDPDSTVRSESSECLGRAELETMDAKGALTRLRELLVGEQARPQWLFVYLAEHFGRDGLAVLRQLTESPGPLQRAAAVAILERRFGVVTLPHMERKPQ